MHAALADATRLRVIDLLDVSDASSSELRDALGVPTNLLAHHLGVLEAAGLVVKHRSEGDRPPGGTTRWTATRSVTEPTPAPGWRSAPRVASSSCAPRTPHARTSLPRSGVGRARSTRPPPGTHPGEEINPGAVAAAERHGLTLPRVAPRLLAEVTGRDGDLVITVCDRAHEELGDSAWAHWSIPDPVDEGTDDAFDRAHHRLAARVASLAPRVASAS